MAARIDIMNAALLELPETTIASEDENSLAARHCRRFYDPVVADLLDFEWSFGRARVALAEITNDREADWGYAYSVPEDMAVLLAVRASQEATAVVGAAYATTGQSEVVGVFVDPSMKLPAISYERSGSTIYTDQPEAVLEYVRNDVTCDEFPPLFRRAVELELATRICMPITKSERRLNMLLPRARMALDSARASDLNRQPQFYGDMPEVMMI